MFFALVHMFSTEKEFSFNLKAHVHPSGFARLSFCFGTVHLSNAVFWLAVISQVRISTTRNFRNVWAFKGLASSLDVLVMT